jgi:hypothetical protein
MEESRGMSIEITATAEGWKLGGTGRKTCLEQVPAQPVLPFYSPFSLLGLRTPAVPGCPLGLFSMSCPGVTLLWPGLGTLSELSSTHHG